MKRAFYTTGFPLLIAVQTYAQELRAPEGGGNYHPASTECVSEQDYLRINTLIGGNIARLKAEGKLPTYWGANVQPGTGHKPTAGTFIWPLKQQPGFDYNSYYGISNYVDVNPLFPNQILDYNCGARTYDQSSGYNHGGIDIFLWPFSQRMQDADQVAVIAATDGVVIAKENGNNDQSCALNGAQWNAVYIGNTDGTICWYGHLKNNSLLTKQVGETVTAGEYLGIVGSSGNSTGPHLHFETHTSVGQVIEPFEGPCNPGQPSLWANQKPYIEPTINAVLTHDHLPVFPDCPQLETINDETNFVTGDTIFLITYYHDQTSTNPSSYKVYKPDNTLLDSWTGIAPQAHYTASYWYWYKLIGNTWPTGNYRFEVTYEGNTVSRNFTVNGNGTNNKGLIQKQNKYGIYPNPNKNTFVLNGLDPNNTTAIQIADITGKIVKEYSMTGTPQQNTFPHNLVPGMYFIKVISKTNHPEVLRFIVK